MATSWTETGANTLPERFPFRVLQDRHYLNHIIGELGATPIRLFGKSTETDPRARDQERRNAIAFFEGIPSSTARPNRKQILQAIGNAPGVCKFPGCNKASLSLREPGWCESCLSKVAVFWAFRKQRPDADDPFIMTTPSLCRHPTCQVGCIKWFGRGFARCPSCDDWAQIIRDDYSDSDDDDDDSSDGRGKKVRDLGKRAIRGFKSLGSHRKGSSSKGRGH